MTAADEYKALILCLLALKTDLDARAANEALEALK